MCCFRDYEAEASYYEAGFEDILADAWARHDENAHNYRPGLQKVHPEPVPARVGLKKLLVLCHPYLQFIYLPNMTKPSVK